MDITKHKQLDGSILDVLDSEELINIYGGGMILANQAVSEYIAGAIQTASNSWNHFVAGFNEGYEKHIK